MRPIHESKVAAYRLSTEPCLISKECRDGCIARAVVDALATSAGVAEIVCHGERDTRGSSGKSLG